MSTVNLKAFHLLYVRAVTVSFCQPSWGCFEKSFLHGCLCASRDPLSPTGEIRLEFARPRERTITSCQSLTPTSVPTSWHETAA